MKKVLISTLGLSPGVVTGAYFELERMDYGRIDRVVTVTTGTTRAKSCERLIRETLHEANPDVEFMPERATTRETLDSSETTERYLKSMEGAIRRHVDEGYKIFLILSGGRKSMVAAAVIAAQKYTFFQTKTLDRIQMFHVEVLDDEIEDKGHISRLAVMQPQEQAIYLHPAPDKVKLVQVPILPLVNERNDLLAKIFEYATGAYLVEGEGYRQVRYSFQPTYLQPDGLGEVDVFAEGDEVGPTSHINVAQLRDLVAYHFNIEELRNLCFELNVDYEELPLFPKSSLVRELIAYLKRREQLHQLLNAAKDHRKNIDWGSVHQLQAILACECKLRLRDDPAGKPITAGEVRRLTHKVAAITSKTNEVVRGWLVTNTPYAEADALSLAKEKQIELKQAVLPDNWRERADWRITGVRPLEPIPS